MTDHASDLHNYLRILAGTDPAGRLIEIRSGIPSGGMRQIFTPATRLELTANTIARLAARTDVYVGVLLRARRAGGRDACERSHLAFIEIDHPDAADRLAQHRCPPTMVISSGGTAGHAHAYWQLQQPVGLDELEQANRRLAIRLGGDLASVDAARILRPPTSRNWKHTPPTQVELLELHLAPPLHPHRTHCRPRRPLPETAIRHSTGSHGHQRSRPPTAGHSGRRLRAGPHRAGAQPRRQNSLPLPQRPQPQSPALRARLVLLRSLPHRRLHLRPRRASLRPRHARPGLPRTPPPSRRRTVAAQVRFQFER